jgi:hypothetical protein
MPGGRLIRWPFPRFRPDLSDHPLHPAKLIVTDTKLGLKFKSGGMPSPTSKKFMRFEPWTSNCTASRTARSRRVTKSTNGPPNLSLDRASIPDRPDQFSETRTLTLPILQFVDPRAPKFWSVRSDPKPVVANEGEDVGGCPRWAPYDGNPGNRLFLPTRGNGR